MARSVDFFTKIGRVAEVLKQASVWFSWVLWHINHCKLFNAKYSLYKYTKHIGFGVVGFYGIPTIAGYLRPNPLYTYILNIYDLIWLSFMAYQPLLVIKCQILFIHIY